MRSFQYLLNNKTKTYYLKGIERYIRDNLIGMGIPYVDGNVLKQTLSIIPPKRTIIHRQLP